MQIFEKMAVVEGILATTVPLLGEAVRAASTCLHLPLYLHYLHAPPVLSLPFHCQELSVLLTQSSPQWLPWRRPRWPVGACSAGCPVQALGICSIGLILWRSYENGD